MSERFEWKVSVAYETEFEVFDTSGVAVTGLVNANFSKTLLKDGASSAQVVTVTEIAGGRYKAGYTPNATGRWHLHVTHATHNKRGWVDDVQAVDRITTDLAFPNVSGRGTDVDASGGVEVGSFQAGALTASAFAAGAIDATALAADAITAAKIANGAIDAATFAAGAIDAAALAADAGAEIADAVWDEARAGHVTAGTFGQGVASVQGNVTGSVGSVASGGIAASSFAANAIDAAAIAADAITAAKIANGAIDAATFAAGAIDATALATDAIGASELSQAAADKVWSSVTRALTDKAGFGLADGAITSAKFGAGAVDAAALATDAANEIADALLNRTAAIDGYTPKQVLSLVAAAVVAKCSGEPNNPITFRSIDDTANRIASTVDADGNRTVVVLTP